MYLEVVQPGNLPGQMFPLAVGQTLVVGRVHSADIRVLGSAISRHHCEVGRDPCGAWVRDLVSRNGTFVNQRQISCPLTLRLRHGDVIAVGRAAQLRLAVTGTDRAWLRWSDGLIPQFAQSIWDENRFEDLPLLADMLTDAGCTDAEILEHCRAGGEHERGCWVVGTLLGKE
jgi:hypothetical protein